MTPEIVTSIHGVDVRLQTHPSLFSPRRVDAGTLAMLSAVRFEADDKILDLGCGYGVVGIVAAKLSSPQRVFMLDIDPVAVEYACNNARLNEVGDIAVVCSNGFTDFYESGFTKILSNPPYHTDFEVAKHFILKGFNRLSVGGTMHLVTKRHTWYRNKLHSIFGGVRVQAAGSYFVFEAEKTSPNYATVGKRKRRPVD